LDGACSGKEFAAGFLLASRRIRFMLFWRPMRASPETGGGPLSSGGVVCLRAFQCLTFTTAFSAYLNHACLGFAMSQVALAGVLRFVILGLLLRPV
jgi:hypothetical protein